MRLLLSFYISYINVLVIKIANYEFGRGDFFGLLQFQLLNLIIIYSIITLQKKIEEAGLLLGLDQMAWIINLVGAWPIQRTLKRNIIFGVYLLYHNLYLVTSYSYLVIVFGNLELMTGNLMESAIQSMTLIRLLTINLSPQLKKNIFVVRQNLTKKHYEDSTEKNLYNRYYLIAKKYCKFTMIFTIVTSVSWYFIPIQTCAISCEYFNKFINRHLQKHIFIFSGFLNKPVVLVAPYKVHLFFNVSSLKRIVILYIFQSPLQYPPICCAATINVNVIIITNICGQMAIFSHRIKNLKTNDSSKKVFNNIVNKHLELVR